MMSIRATSVLFLLFAGCANAEVKWDTVTVSTDLWLRTYTSCSSDRYSVVPLNPHGNVAQIHCQEVTSAPKSRLILGTGFLFDNFQIDAALDPGNEFQSLACELIADTHINGEDHLYVECDRQVGPVIDLIFRDDFE